MCIFFSNKTRQKTMDRAGATKREAKKNHSGQIIKSKNLIEENTAKTEALLTLATGKPSYDAIKPLVGELKYLNPSVDSAVVHKDEKISDKLGDMKIKLASERDKTDDILQIIKDIKFLLAEREALSKK